MKNGVFRMAVISVATAMALSGSPCLATQTEDTCSGGSIEVNGKVVKKWGVSQEECTSNERARHDRVKAALKDPKEMKKLLVETCEGQKDDPEKYKSCIEMLSKLEL